MAVRRQPRRAGPARPRGRRLPRAQLGGDPERDQPRPRDVRHPLAHRRDRRALPARDAGPRPAGRPAPDGVLPERERRRLALARRRRARRRPTRRLRLPRPAERDRRVRVRARGLARVHRREPWGCAPALAARQARPRRARSRLHGRHRRRPARRAPLRVRHPRGQARRADRPRGRRGSLADHRRRRGALRPGRVVDRGRDRLAQRSKRDPRGAGGVTGGLLHGAPRPRDGPLRLHRARGLPARALDGPHRTRPVGPVLRASRAVHAPRTGRRRRHLRRPRPPRPRRRGDGRHLARLPVPDAAHGTRPARAVERARRFPTWGRGSRWPVVPRIRSPARWPQLASVPGVSFEPFASPPSSATIGTHSPYEAT